MFSDWAGEITLSEALCGWEGERPQLTRLQKGTGKERTRVRRGFALAGRRRL